MAVAHLNTGTAQTFVNQTVGNFPLTTSPGAPSAGSNRLAILVIGVGDDISTHTSAAPTYGGQTMTEIGTGVAGGWPAVEVWCLKESGIAAMSGSAVSISYAQQAQQIAYNVVCFQGVDQTTPIDTGSIQTANTAGTTAGVTISIASGNMGFAVVMSDAEGGLSAETGTQSFETGAIDADTVLAAQHSATAGSTALNWTQANTNLAVLGFEINADGAAAAATPPVIPPRISRVRKAQKRRRPV